ncbi:uncharacterized protein MELLADRAFT_58363 [Melampsora larici-populina 98AG31]|uniref:Uncharacterized protein n=1 Tax=Melampsora larici-populina (strain 98AG31 / pathotype 3-4-7) TaxID=747676 RepID=F4R380_MELLP|nr:uncharacterized protein MELLADRAFT_58363 [Melampsora larici-populina 98AG31]EGG12581.1 hypothetical protein MELLADRAFT_58363 [Melampsora larici-populina 98AG31]
MYPDDNPDLQAHKWMVEVVGSAKPTSKEKLIESKLVLQSVYSRLSRNFARLWIFWSGGMNGLMIQTKTYSSLNEIEERLISTQWEVLVARSRTVWNSTSQAEILDAAPLDEGEEAEQLLMELEVDDGDDELGFDRRVDEATEDDGGEDDADEGIDE